MLAGVFGYDKYSEVTSEFAIRGTYCDLAIKIDGALKTLIEAELLPSVAFGHGHIVTQPSAPLLWASTHAQVSAPRRSLLGAC